MAYGDIGVTTVGQIKTAAFFNQIRDNFETLKTLANSGQLVWDDTNGRLGVGIATPGYDFHLRQSRAGRVSFSLENSHGTSKSAQINFGGVLGSGATSWSLGNDLASNGGRDLFLYDNVAGVARLIITQGGSLLIGKTSGLTGAGDMDVAGNMQVGGNFQHTGSFLSFFNSALAGKLTISGSRAGNVALANLLSSLAGYGLITNSTTA